MWVDHYISVFYDVPVASARPRFNRHTGSAYLPTKSAKEVTRIAGLIKHKMQKDYIKKIPKHIAVSCVLHFVHKKPKSHKKSTYRMPKVTRPDIDNLTKTYLDSATKAGLWHDDSQVAKLLCEDYYAATGEDPHIIFKVSYWLDAKIPKPTWLDFDPDRSK